MGCFTQGCLILLVVCVVVGIGVGVAAWFVYSQTVDTFTSTQPADVKIEQPSDAAFQAAENQLNQLRQAALDNKESTIEFSSADINALIARDSNFSGIRGKGRVNIANSIVTMEVSTPLSSVPLPRIRNRWFNGQVRFGLAYTLDQFVFDGKSAEANGHELPASVFFSFTPSFNKSFNESFQRGLREHPQNATFWKRIKSVQVQDDKLIVTTKGE